MQGASPKQRHYSSTTVQPTTQVQSDPYRATSGAYRPYGYGGYDDASRVNTDPSYLTQT